MKSLVVIVLCVTCLVVSGCVNSFTQFYQPATFPSGNLQPYSGETRLMATDDIMKSSDEVKARGYEFLGACAFTTTGRVTLDQLKEQGKAVGADVIVWTGKLLGADQTNVPVTVYHPGKVTTTTYSGMSNASSTGAGGTAYGTGTYSGQSTTVGPATVTTENVAITVNRWEYAATFWRKSAR